MTTAKMSARMLSFAVAVALAAVLAGCGGAGHAPRHRESVLAALTATLEGGRAQWAGEAAMTDATELVTQQCMHRLGLTYFTSFVTPSQEEGSAWFPYPDQSLAYARREGYGLHALAVQDAEAHTTHAIGGNGAASTDPEELYELSLRGRAKARYNAALGGHRYAQFSLVGTNEAIRYPTTGCVAVGEKRVYGSVADYFDITDQIVGIANLLAGRATAMPGYLRAIGRWRECMRAKGFSYRSPDAARAALANEPIREQVTTRFQELEIRVAVSDINCQYRAGVRQAYAAALVGAARSQSARISADVIRIASEQAHAVQVANRLLAQAKAG